MEITVLSWNLACTGRDAKEGNPLANRLEAICARLSTVQQKTDAQVVVIQEIRPTDSTDLPALHYSAAEVAEEIRASLGAEWNLYLQRVNSSHGAFYRATLWDSHELVAVRHMPTPTDNHAKPAFGYLILESVFARVGAEWTDAAQEVHVVNMHAPTGPLADKKAYWTRIAAMCADQRTVALGDANKFGDEREIYGEALEAFEVQDHVQQHTFMAFPYDTQPDGTPWRSCLDAVVVAKETQLKDIRVFVESTVKSRESDHFLVGATFTVDM